MPRNPTSRCAVYGPCCPSRSRVHKLIPQLRPGCSFCSEHLHATNVSRRFSYISQRCAKVSERSLNAHRVNHPNYHPLVVGQHQRFLWRPSPGTLSDHGKDSVGLRGCSLPRDWSHLQLCHWPSEVLTSANRALWAWSPWLCLVVDALLCAQAVRDRIDENERTQL